MKIPKRLILTETLDCSDEIYSRGMLLQLTTNTYHKFHKIKIKEVTYIWYEVLPTHSKRGFREDYLMGLIEKGILVSY